MGNTSKSPDWQRLFGQIDEAINLQDCIVEISKALNIEYVSYRMKFNDSNDVTAPYLKTTFPAEWVRQYIVQRYANVDPVVLEGFKLDKPCFWSELDWTSPAAVSYQKDMARHGLTKSGYVIPVTSPNNRQAMMNFASLLEPNEWEYKISTISAQLIEYSNLIHKKVMADLFDEIEDYPALSPREIQCLNWVAQGKDAQSIADILGISGHTVRDYCKSARLKLGCGNLPQAIHKATIMQMID